VVRIDLPPPQFAPSPVFFELPLASQILRIFDPTRYQTQALTFCHNGPRSRFDHHFPNQNGNPQDDPQREIYYAAFTLSSCLVEYFGDLGLIEIQAQCLAQVTLTRKLKLLDIRGSGAMKAGSVAALAKAPDRDLSQSWSRYFYENQQIYTQLDGLLYFNAHNDEEAIALYERAQDGLLCPSNRAIRLDHPRLRSAIQQAALDNNLIFIG
jgi:RES domain